MYVYALGKVRSQTHPRDYLQFNAIASSFRNRFLGGRGCQIVGKSVRVFGFLCEDDGRKCATKCATKHRFLRLLSVLYGSFIVFINQSHGGGFCPSSGLIECEAKPQQALFADFLEGCK